MLAVDDRQTAHGRTGSEELLLNVELLVVLHALDLTPVRIALLPNRATFVHRHRIGHGPGVHGPVRAIHVHARDHDAAPNIWERLEREPGRGTGDLDHVDEHVRRERIDFTARARQFGAMRVHVAHIRVVLRLDLTTVDHEHVVPSAGQILHERAPDETRSAQHERSH